MISQVKSMFKSFEHAHLRFQSLSILQFVFPFRLHSFQITLTPQQMEWAHISNIPLPFRLCFFSFFFVFIFVFIFILYLDYLIITPANVFFRECVSFPNVKRCSKFMKRYTQCHNSICD